jgi:RNA polymerase sigma factor (sigma-70 family)
MNSSQRALHQLLATLSSRPARDESDAQLVERFLAHRSEAEETARAADRAFEALVARHGPMVQGVCRRVLDDPNDADDAFQATFLVLFRRAGSVRIGGSLGPWLYGVARRIALRARADRGRRGPREDRGGERPDTGPAADACRAELQSILDEEVGRLPERYRAPVVLCLLEGLTYDEAARRLGCPIGTLGVRLSRGRELLRARLTRRGVAPASAAFALRPVPGPVAVAGRLTRAALRADRLTSARVAALAQKEIATMFGMKAWLAAAVVATTVAVTGSIAWVAGAQGGPVAEEPEPGASAVTQADANPTPTDLGALVENQEGPLKRIRSLQCVIDLRVSDDAGKTWKTMARLKVCRSGARERVHCQQFWIRDRDKVVRDNSVNDVLLGPDGVLSIAGFDPDQPPREPVTATEQAAAGVRISGVIRPAQPNGPWGYKGALAADYMALFLPDPRYSLRELSEATAKAVPVGRRDDQGQSVWDLALQSPDSKTGYVVTLSPAHGYAIAETQAVQVADPTRLKSVNRVLEFQEPAPGIFLPKTVRQTMSWAPAIVIETVIHDVAINGPVNDANLAFRFPEGIGVADTGKNVQYVWGKGAPARTFKTVDELNEWNLNQVDPGTARSRGITSGTSNITERYAVLIREFETRSREFARTSRNARTAAERQDVARRLRPDPASYAVRFLDLAKQEPGASAALYALARAATLSGSPVTEEAVELLRKNWATSPAVAESLLPVGLSASFAPGTEPFLREVLARNPSREAQAHAAYALASLLFSLSELHRLYAQGRQEAEGLERQYGKEQLNRLLARDPAGLVHEAERLMTRVASEYADVKLHPDRPKETRTLGRLAKAWLRQEDEPIVGRAAPAIEGKDLNGQTVRLSDYRGKVVVVVFWASWCRPCLAMIAQEKALAQRLADKPFALLGVNCDATLGEARKVVAAQSVTWPNWHDGVPTEGKIAERYQVAGHGIPAIFVIDREGVLRHKWIASSAELDKAVDALLGKDGAAGK